jgi:predicted nicotinamide N-methyase
MPRRTDSPSPARLRAFVRRHTRLRPVPDVPGVRLHMADDAMTVMHLAGDQLGQVDPPLPFWAFPWAGGLAVARYLIDHPEEVAGRHILDLASGSGLCAIVALRAGAASAQAVDIDPLAEAAVALNAHANGVRIGFRLRDILDDPPPAADVILAGDVCYEETMAGRMLAWLRLAARQGTRVLIGDPGRAYLPSDLARLATYQVSTSRELEDAEVKPSAVYALSAAQ